LLAGAMEVMEDVFIMRLMAVVGLALAL